MFTVGRLRNATQGRWWEEKVGGKDGRKRWEEKEKDLEERRWHCMAKGEGMKEDYLGPG